MADVGINISMKSNIPQVARESATALREMSSVASDMQKALTMSNVEGQYKEFADRINKYHDYLKLLNEQQRLQRGTLGSLPSGTTGSMLHRVGGVVSNVGATGDVLSGATDVLDTLGNIVSKSVGKLGVGGKIAGGAMLAGAGLAFAGNAIEKLYEKQMKGVMNVSASLYKFGKTADETSENFRKVMNEVIDTSSKFGRSLEEGMQVYNTLLKGGIPSGSLNQLGNMTSAILSYAVGYGVSESELAQPTALMARFGIAPKTALGYAAGQRSVLGMNRSQIVEVLQAQAQMFEEGISRGIVKSYRDINSVQTWIGQLGDAFKGQYGIGLYNKMEQSAVGATSLQSQGNILMYQAAYQMLRSKGKPFTYIDVMKQLEKGATPELLNNVKSLITGITGGNEANSIEMLRQVYNVNYSTAEKLWQASSIKEAKKILSAESEKVMETPEGRLLKAQNEVMGKILNFAKDLTPIKTRIVESTDKIISLLEQIVNGNKKAKEEAKKRIEERDIITNTVGDTVNRILSSRRPTGRVGAGAYVTASEHMYSGLTDLFTKNPELISVFNESLDPVHLGLSKKQSELLYKQLYDRLYRYSSPDSEGGITVTRNEFQELIGAISVLAVEIKKNTDAQGRYITIKTKGSGTTPKQNY